MGRPLRCDARGGQLEVLAIDPLQRGDLSRSEPGPGPPCLDFESLAHCAVGAATLELSPAGDRLTVRNPNQRIDSGVSIDVPDASIWSATVQPQFAAGATDVLRSTALSDGVVISRSDVRQTSDGFAFSASFPASGGDATYSALVFRDGVFQGMASNIRSGTVGATLGVIILVMGDDGIEEEYEELRAFNWRFRLLEAELIRLADGTKVLGDEIHLVEEASASGGQSSPTFDRLVFQGNFTRLDFSAESFE